VRPRLAAVLVGLLVAAGCGRGGPECVPVEGTVRLGGKPLAGVEVTFHPAAGGAAARGTTDAAGRYTLAAADGKPGAAAGKYLVTVKRPPAGRPANWETETRPPPPAGPPVPLPYTSAATTPLEREVAVGGPAVIDFDLEP
jgi:hypothetical protein